MTKQGDIRGVLEQLYQEGRLTPVNTLHALSKRGVVIKVGEISDDLAQTASEFPRYFARGKHMALVSTERTSHIFKDFKDMGYVAVEPLVEK